MPTRWPWLFGIILLFAASAQAQDSALPAELDLSVSNAMTNAAESESAAAGQSDRALMFQKDQWTFQTYGSASFLDDAGELYLWHGGVGVALQDNLTLNLEAVSGYLDIDDHGGSEGGGAGAIGLDLLLRWHFLNRPGFSLYVEGGAGILQSTRRFPADGTHFNFTPQGGLGLTWQISEQAHLMGGARWHHISNADKDGDRKNPGADELMLYAGVMVPF